MSYIYIYDISSLKVKPTSLLASLDASLFVH